MDLDERLRLRDLLLGEERRDELNALLASPPPDEAVRHLIDALGPAFALLGRIVDEHLPLGTPTEAVDYALTHASGFDVASVLEYCGADEGQGGHSVDEVRRLLADHVDAGRLSVEYMFDCPRCGNMIAGRSDLPVDVFEVYCEHDRCRVTHRIDPAAAHAVYVNASEGPALRNWI